MKRKSALPPPPPPRYDEWFRCMFQRPEPLWWNKKIDFTDEYRTLEADYDFRGTDAEVFELATYTLANCGRLLTTCSNDQIAEGISLLFDNSNSDICFQYIAARKAGADVQPFFDSIVNLYRDVLAKRCEPALCHRNEGHSYLNGRCYMLWDASPLSSWGSILDEKTGKYPLIEALSAVLRIPNDACIESAIHGLGHMVYGLQKRGDTKTIPLAIDAFIRSTPGLRPELRAYAEHAKSGRIQ